MTNITQSWTPAREIHDNASVSQVWEDIIQPSGQEPTRWAAILGAVIMLVFFIEGIAGGIWIILAVLSRRKVWNIINIFIVSLCINDVLVMFLIVILIIESFVWGQWTAGEVMCKLNPEFTVVFTGCSLWHSALIAIHRYLVVVHNNLYKRISKRAYVIFVLLAARIIPFACTLPGLALESSGYVPKLLRCILLPKEAARMITITIVQIVVPCVIVVLCYTFVFAFVVRIGRRMQTANRAMKHEIQITKMFGVIFLMIMVGFIPYAIVRNADRDNKLSADIYVMVSVCYGIATCCSPLVYGAMSRELRQACCMALKDWLHAIHADRFSPCCLSLIAPKTCFDTSNDMDTYDVSMAVTAPVVERFGNQTRHNDNGSNAALIQMSAVAEEAGNRSIADVGNGTLSPTHLELHVDVDESRCQKAPDGNAAKPEPDNGCDETAQLLTGADSGTTNDGSESLPNPDDKVASKPPQGKAPKVISFFCASDDAKSGERSRETSNVSNSQTDTIENESESANVSYEMSAFV